MSTEVSLFPSTRTEALTMLYLQNQDLSNVSTDELVQMYADTHEKIKEGFKERRKPVKSYPL